MTDPGRLDHLLGDERINAWLSWLLVGFVVLVAVASFLDGDLLWVVFSAAVVAIVLVPPVAHRNPRMMLPWEVLVLVLLPVFGRLFATFALTSDAATYLSVAGVALLVAVELDVFTPVRMNNWFAVLFVVIATMATAGVWAIVQWVSDLYLGTTFIYPARPPLTPAQERAALDALMWDFVAATAAGILAGAVFVFYFRRRADTEVRLPEDLSGDLPEDVEEVLE